MAQGLLPPLPAVTQGMCLATFLLLSRRELPINAQTAEIISFSGLFLPA